MYKGMYIALSGAKLKQKHLDIFAQNIANSSTSGYKKERISFKDFIVPSDNRTPLTKDGRVMTEVSAVVTDYSTGGLIRTGNPLDLAITGKGFFALEDNRYTRNGQFQISAEGDLETAEGIKVLGDGGPITVQGSSIEISASGEILVDGISAGSLKVVDFNNREALRKINGTMFKTDQAAQELEADISQGYLEASNVEVVKEMVQMITALREFESYQKMIHAFDEATSKTVNEMGR
jgi:flagellar basal-body rod protein FlgG